MRVGEAQWIRVIDGEKVDRYLAEGWKIVERWVGCSFDSYLMVREEIQKESSLDGK